MEKIDFQLIIIGIVLVIISRQCHETIMEVRALRKLLKRDMQAHQDWLFNQLYSLAPGKVLRPDELESEVENKPATIINRARDPMNEFTGHKDDWHGKLDK